MGEEKKLTSEQLVAMRWAPSGDGEFADTWRDKPHRLIYDLLNHIDALEGERDGWMDERNKWAEIASDRNDEIDSLRAQLTALQTENKRLNEELAKQSWQVDV